MPYNEIVTSFLNWTPITILFGTVKAQSAPPSTYKFAALSFLCGISCGFIISYVSRRIFSRPTKGTEELQPETIYNDFGGNVKMVLVVRSDLKMGKGKAAAQCAHAAVKGYRLAEQFCPELLMDWLQNGEPKVVLKTDMETDLRELKRAAQEQGLIASIIRDAGRTQIAPNSRTVLGIGPGPSSVIDSVTGGMKYRYKLLNSGYKTMQVYFMSSYKPKMRNTPEELFQEE